MKNARQRFLERHPGVRPEELDELLRGSVRRKRWLVAGIVALALLLLSFSAVGLRVHHVVQNDADVIASEIASEQLAAARVVLTERAELGRELAVRVATFTVSLAADNEILRTATDRWDDLEDRVSAIRTDVGGLRDEPVEAGKRLAKAIPELLEALIQFVAGVLGELERLGPHFASALQGAKDVLTAEEVDADGLLDALETALDPLMGDNLAQRMAWQNLRAEMVAWQTGLRKDLAELRANLQGEELRREYTSRLVDAFFGRR